MNRNLRWIGPSLGLLCLALWTAYDGTPDPNPAEEASHAASELPQKVVQGAPTTSSPADSTRVLHDVRVREARDGHEAAMYQPHQRMVRVTDPMDLDGILASHGLELERPPGRSGYALVSGSEDALEDLHDDARIGQVLPHATMAGASTTSLRHAQWHIDKVQPPSADDDDDDDNYTVAVLDSGVAYETATRFGERFTQAPSLASSRIVAPWDFVNDDPHANDDHGHGTHIASVIASDGDVQGISPGVGLMPLKVLDEHNLGTELDLVEAILHAVEHDAHVINMSLSFGEGYQPSFALLDALQAAHDADVVMVAASGNDGADYVSWPAASPLVIAVGASAPSTRWKNDRQEPASYANLSAAVDVLAPGGSLTADRNGDGMVDGILAESVDPSDPSTVGYWLMAGTSQAAAMASGLAVEFLREGVEPHQVYAAMQSEAEGPDHMAGSGGGYLRTEWGLFDDYDHAPAKTFQVSVLPFIKDLGNGYIAPAAQVTVFDEDGQTVSSPDCVNVYVKIWGNEDDLQSCHTHNGSCTVTGASVPRSNGQGDIPHAWSVAVEGVALWYTHTIHRPLPALTATDAVQSVVGALEADPGTRDAMIGWSWTNTHDTHLGRVAEGYTVVDSGSGFASLPFGLILTEPALRSLGVVKHRTVDAGGEPVDFTLLEVNGSGLASLPLGLRRFKIPRLHGTGLPSHPQRLPADHMLGRGPTFVPLGGSGLASLPLGLRGTPVGNRVSNGGWRVEGYSVASALGTSTKLAIAPAFAAYAESAAVDTVRHDH